MTRLFTAALSGTLFALGLTVSGMTLPARVLGFLDVTGHWDPSLAFVMVGALAVYAPLYRVIARSPTLNKLELPQNRRIDAPLLVGAAVFGVGWGVAGMCPGPALVALGSFAPEACVFVSGMVLGALGFQLFDGLVHRRQSEHSPALAQANDA